MALATLLTALALVACGGGDDGKTSAGGEETSQAPGLAQVQERADEIKKERQQERGEGKAGAEEGTGGDSGSRGSTTPDEEPAAAPPVEHSDSGGGAAQFQRKGGDNSIQEYGAEGGASDLAAAAAVLHAYLDSRVAGNWDEACSYLSAQTVASIEQFAQAYATDQQLEGCPDVLEAVTGGRGKETLREAAQADVGSLRMEGNGGFLLYHGARDLDYGMPVVQEGGAWKLTAPEGSPLP